MKLSKNSRNCQITICNSINPNHFNTDISNKNFINIHLYLNKNKLDPKNKVRNSYKSSYDIFKHVKIEDDIKTKNIIHKILNSPSHVLITQTSSDVQKIKEMRSFRIKNIRLNNLLSPVANRDKQNGNESNNYKHKHLKLRTNLSEQSLFTNASSDIKGNSYLNISTSANKRYLPKMKYYSASSQSQRYQNVKPLNKHLYTNSNRSEINEDIHINNVKTQPNSNNKIKQIHLQSKNQHKPKKIINTLSTSKNTKRFIRGKSNSILLSLKTRKHIQSKNNRNSEIFTFSPKIKIERFPISIISEHCSKTLYTNTKTFDTSTIDFYLERIFDIPSFSIYGICQGDEKKNSFLIASTVKNALIDLLTNILTYNVSFNPISDDILKAITLNNYEIIHLLFKGSDNEIKGMLRVNNNATVAYSVGLVFVIGNEIIYVNYGYSVLISIIRQSMKLQKEYVDSEDIVHITDKKITIERKSFERDIKYIVICNRSLNRKEIWRNILKIIVNEKVKCINEVNCNGMLCTLNDKINFVYEYICKIDLNHDINFSMIILKF